MCKCKGCEICKGHHPERACTSAANDGSDVNFESCQSWCNGGAHCKFCKCKVRPRTASAGVLVSDIVEHRSTLCPWLANVPTLQAYALLPY